MVVVVYRDVMSNSCDPMDCSLPGSSVNGILQARILEWVAMPSSCICIPSLLDFLPISIQFTTEH